MMMTMMMMMMIMMMMMMMMMMMINVLSSSPTWGIGALSDAGDVGPYNRGHPS
jgi:hypothetical protein